MLRKKAYTPKWMIVLLLLFFSPAAWYFMWKEKRYHLWFPNIVIVNALIIFGLLILFILVVFPQLSRVFLDVKLTQTTLTASQFAFVLAVLTTIQMFFGLYVRKIVKKKGDLPKFLLWTCIGIFLFNYLCTNLLPGTTLTTIIFPIYRLTTPF